MHDPSLETFKQSTLLSVLICTILTAIYLDYENALANLAGGLYCMFSIWSYERLCLSLQTEGDARKGHVYLMLLLKLLLIFSLISIALSSQVLKYFPSILIGTLMFIPGSIITALIVLRLR